MEQEREREGVIYIRINESVSGRELKKEWGYSM